METQSTNNISMNAPSLLVLIITILNKNETVFVLLKDKCILFSFVCVWPLVDNQEVEMLPKWDTSHRRPALNRSLGQSTEGEGSELSP